MANGRCRLHGGLSTGPRTAAGLARMIAAKTTHGSYAMSGAAQRAQQRYFRALAVRTRLTCLAHRLRPYLPAEAAARLETVPAELLPPKHPSQLAWEALHATTPCADPAPARGTGRRRAALARGEAAGGGTDGAAAVALRGRAAERAAARVEAAAQAAWRAAIKAALGAQRAARAAARAARGSSNDPMHGAAVRRRARGSRNDPMRGAPAGAGAPAGHPAGEAVGWAPGSPGLAEALAREVMLRQLRAALAARGNDPMQGAGAGHQSGTPRNNPMQGAARDAPAEARVEVGPARALPLASTPLARTWQPPVAELLAARFGPPAVAGWPGPLAPPPGIAAVSSGDWAQRPYAWAAGGGGGGAGRGATGVLAAPRQAVDGRPSPAMTGGAAGPGDRRDGGMRRGWRWGCAGMTLACAGMTWWHRRSVDHSDAWYMTQARRARRIRFLLSVSVPLW